jgi:hypothetical protein
MELAPHPCDIDLSGLTASVHQRPLMIALAAVWCNAC